MPIMQNGGLIGKTPCPTYAFECFLFTTLPPSFSAFCSVPPLFFPDFYSSQGFFTSKLKLMFPSTFMACLFFQDDIFLIFFTTKKKIRGRTLERFITISAKKFFPCHLFFFIIKKNFFFSFDFFLLFVFNNY